MIEIINFLNPFNPTEFAIERNWFNGMNLGGFSNYFQLSINFLIPVILIQFIVWLRQRKKFWIILIWVLLASLILPIFCQFTVDMSGMCGWRETWDSCGNPCKEKNCKVRLNWTQD